MPLLGFNVPRKEIDLLFESFDPDGSGTIELGELNALLRRGGEVKLGGSLEPGAAGAIVLESKAKHALRKADFLTLSPLLSPRLAAAPPLITLPFPHSLRPSNSPSNLPRH